MDQMNRVSTHAARHARAAPPPIQRAIQPSFRRTAQGLRAIPRVYEAAAQLAVFFGGAAQLVGQALVGQPLAFDPLAQIEDGPASLVVLEQRGRRHRTGRQAQHRQPAGKDGAPTGRFMEGGGTHQR
jgi:hypothetical protein